MMPLTVEPFYSICGLFMIGVAGGVAADVRRPRRWGAVGFWALLGAVFMGGPVFPPVISGYLILALVALAAAGQVRPPQRAAPDRAARVGEAARLGNRVLWPVLAVPATAVAGSLLLGRWRWQGKLLAEPAQAPLIALGVGVVLALLWGLRATGSGVRVAAAQGGRLLELVGWALILPQLLAALGGIFATAGVGEVVAGLTARALPTELPWVAVTAYCLGMALFTMCLGNAFAAFAVITGGIGLPFIVRLHGGNPAIMAAMGMLAGYCGTLVTPMAANFNIVPALLLDLEDRHAVIKAQVPIALAVFAANLALMGLCVYRY
jgi:uncharacterized membrane protein